MRMKVRKDEYGLLTNGYEGYKHGVSGMGSGGLVGNEHRKDETMDGDGCVD